MVWSALSPHGLSVCNVAGDAWRARVAPPALGTDIAIPRSPMSAVVTLVRRRLVVNPHERREDHPRADHTSRPDPYGVWGSSELLCQRVMAPDAQPLRPPPEAVCRAGADISARRSASSYAPGGGRRQGRMGVRLSGMVATRPPRCRASSAQRAALLERPVTARRGRARPIGAAAPVGSPCPGLAAMRVRDRSPGRGSCRSVMMREPWVD